MFFCHLRKIALVTSCLFPRTRNLSKKGLLLKERLCSCRSELFPSWVYPTEKWRGKLEKEELLTLKVDPFTLMAW